MMNTPVNNPQSSLARYGIVPWVLMGFGIASVALSTPGPKQLAFSYLVAFSFYLSLCLGALFMVMMHHLFDAAWSVPIRRIMEHIACFSFPALSLLFVPIALVAPQLYPSRESLPIFYLLSAACLISWGFLSNRLRHWSLEQDKTGAARCTYKMRAYSAGGIVLFAITLTVASTLWIQAATPNWFSTIYSLWYFSGSIWITVATLYVIIVLLQRAGHWREVLREEQFYFLGSLFLAFTIFHAYIAYSQYFVIWNANIPQETSWYTLREQGTWKIFSMILIFGHFLVPFLMLLRVKSKLNPAVILWLGAWAWLMHFCDLEFQIVPPLHPAGPPVSALVSDLGCLLFLGGILCQVFVRSFMKYPSYPQRDPRMAESMGIHPPPTSDIATAPERVK